MADLKISFVDSFTNSGVGIGSVDVEVDGEGHIMNWREDHISAINQIPSPYEDPYGFIKEIFDAAGIDVELDIYFKDSDDDALGDS